MSKSKEELNALKEEAETLNEKMHELTEEELENVNGGGLAPNPFPDGEPDFRSVGRL